MARTKRVWGNRWRTPSRSVSGVFSINVLCSRDIPYFEPHCLISVVTQRYLWGRALRDDAKNGCVADYPAPDSYHHVTTYSFTHGIWKGNLTRTKVLGKRFSSLPPLMHGELTKEVTC